MAYLTLVAISAGRSWWRELRGRGNTGTVVAPSPQKALQAVWWACGVPLPSGGPLPGGQGDGRPARHDASPGNFSHACENPRSSQVSASSFWCAAAHDPLVAALRRRTLAELVMVRLDTDELPAELDRDLAVGADIHQWVADDIALMREVRGQILGGDTWTPASGALT